MSAIKNKKIKELSFQLIQNKLKYNLLHLISDICLRIDESLPYDIPDKLKTSEKNISSYTCEIKEILCKSIDKRDDFIKKITNEKHIVAEIARPLCIYANFTEKISILVSEEIKLRKLKSAPTDEKINYTFVLDDCHKFIESSDDNMENRFKMGGLISCLPLKMTKAKYNDYIKASLNIMFKELNKNFIINSIELLKSKIAPFKTDDFGKYFPLMADKLNELWQMNYSSLSDKELDEIYKTLDSTNADIECILEYISALYDNLNYILNIVLFCIDLEYMFEDDILFKDMYYSVCNLIQTDDNIFKDDILDRIFERIELLENEIEPMDNNFKDLTKNIDFDTLPEDIQTCAISKIKIDVNFNTDIYFELSRFYYTEENNSDADEKFIDSETNKFIDFIENINVSNAKLKFLKNKFLEYILCPMKHEEFMNYLEYVFEGIKETEKEFIYLSNILEFFDYSGYSPENEEDHNHKHNHHGCSCGHHH